jgi:hypothetical protein
MVVIMVFGTFFTLPLFAASTNVKNIYTIDFLVRFRNAVE